MLELRGIYHVKTGRERFWTKVQIRGLFDCWLWQAGTRLSTNGGWGDINEPLVYGRINVNGFNRAAHAVAWELFCDEKLKPGDHVHHRCENSLCCNPLHLIRTTASEHLAHHNRRRTVVCPHGIVGISKCRECQNAKAKVKRDGMTPEQKRIWRRQHAKRARDWRAKQKQRKGE